MSDRTSNAFCDGVQSSFDFFAPASPARRSVEEPPAAAAARDEKPSIDLTPEPPFSIAADHLRALKKKAG